MSRNDLDTSNLLLSQLDQGAADLLRPHLSRVQMERLNSLHACGERVECAYFIEAGMVSCVAVDGADRTEIGLIGREGLAGVGAVLGDDAGLFQVYVQVNGTAALAIPVSELRRAMDVSPSLRRVLGRYVHYYLLQVSYATVSSRHLMEARLARWLLMCHDRLEGDEIALTHEFMALMISAQRSGVTITLHTLEGAGMIRSTRGLVTIRDREKLVRLAGESYGVPEGRYRELIGPFGK